MCSFQEKTQTIKMSYVSQYAVVVNISDLYKKRPPDYYSYSLCSIKGLVFEFFVYSFCYMAQYVELYPVLTFSWIYKSIQKHILWKRLFKEHSSKVCFQMIQRFQIVNIFPYGHILSLSLIGHHLGFLIHTK